MIKQSGWLGWDLRSWLSPKSKHRDARVLRQKAKRRSKAAKRAKAVRRD